MAGVVISRVEQSGRISLTASYVFDFSLSTSRVLVCMSVCMSVDIRVVMLKCNIQVTVVK